MLRLTGNKVGVIPIADPPKIGHIWIPDEAKERTDQGVIKYLGPDVKDLRIGMYVCFSGYSGTVLNLEDPDTLSNEKIIIIPEDFVIAEIDDLGNFSVPGLYVKTFDMTFEAPYKAALELIAQAIREQREKHSINIVTRHPDVAEYDKLRGG